MSLSLREFVHRKLNECSARMSHEAFQALMQTVESGVLKKIQQQESSVA